MRRTSWRRLAVVLGVVGALGLAACGRSAPQGPGTSSSVASSSRSSSGVSVSLNSKLPVQQVAVADLGSLLPTPLEGLAAVAWQGKIYLFGGSGPAGFNATVWSFTPTASGGVISRAGSLPVALHDAGAAPTSTGVLVCGGGQSVGSSDVYLWTPSGTRTVAPLPIPLSDLEGVSAQGSPWCLGGWTGTEYSDAVWALDPTGAAAPRLALHLPEAVRYGAAAALPGGILLAGGDRVNRGPTSSVQWVPLAGAGKPAVVAALPSAVDKAMAATVGQQALVLGGCTASGTPERDIWSLDALGEEQAVGKLPAGRCYGAAAWLDGRVYVFGGLGPGGQALADVLELRPLYGLPGA